ncbi:hypothetical protein CC78DRAFT_443184, partial [Lojkania enalia]
KRSMGYHFRTIWLFAKSDLKTVVFPQTIFGCVALLSRGAFQLHVTAESFNSLSRIPLVIVWIWFNLLGEAIANQRLPESIIEDTINKPWRPLPSKRLTPDEARHLLLWILPAIYLVGRIFGASDSSVALMVLSYMYNDLGGANENWLFRNALNACGLSFFSLGAAQVAWGPRATPGKTVYAWIATLAAVISSTIQVQDLPDIEGDRARSRKTMPLIYGDILVRWSVGIATLFWSFYCPYYWSLHLLGYIPSVFFGSFIAVRVLLERNSEADAVTWKLWCAWMGLLYLLP